MGWLTPELSAVVVSLSGVAITAIIKYGPSKNGHGGRNAAAVSQGHFDSKIELITNKIETLAGTVKTNKEHMEGWMQSLDNRMMRIEQLHLNGKDKTKEN